MKIATYIFAAIGLLHVVLDLAVWFFLWKWARDMDRDEITAKELERLKREGIA